MPKKISPPGGRVEQVKKTCIKPAVTPEATIPTVDKISPEAVVEEAKGKLKRGLTDIQEPAAYCCEAAATIKAADLPAE